MNMENIKIEVVRENYIVVRADTKRFGAGEVMFEGNTFNQCFDYIKRETGRADPLRLQSCLAYGEYTDWQGRTFPSFMRVLN